jgi:hypothetical protein
LRHLTALLRRLARDLLRADPAKGSIRVKVKKAGRQDDDILTLLRQMR